MVTHYETIAIPPGIKVRKAGVSPRWKTVVITSLISLSLFLSQLLFILGTPGQPAISVIRNYEERSSLNEIRERPSCFKNYLGIEAPPVKPNGSCHLIKSPRGYCSVLQKLFAKKPEKCSKEHIKFCSCESGEIKCSVPQECNEKKIYIGYFDATSMKTIWLLISPPNIEVTINTFRKRASFKGYVFIACITSNDNKLSLADFEYSQLFNVRKENHQLTNSSEENLPNLNFIMLDSVSRPHFYRSLPNTIKALEMLKSKKRTDTFDYSFMQAITQGTYESLEALFTGYVNTSQNAEQYLNLGKLLGRLKSKGYQTNWVEDSCWKHTQGLVAYFKHNTSEGSQTVYEDLQRYIEENFIDDAQFSLLSCDLINAIKKKTANSSALCFNGKYFHDYLLDYVFGIHQASYKSNISTFTFMHLTTGRDYSGTRIQTLDDSLSAHLQSLASFDNTITFLFSNHGNTNGMLVEASFEGYIEAFNPFLFIILPTKLKRWLTQSESRNLRDNQQKLMSLLDVHGFFMPFVEEEPLNVQDDFKTRFIIENGLLNRILHSRSCYDIPVILPNLCICREYESHVVPTNLHVVLADFCVGSINNLILHQRFSDMSRSFGRCEVLMLAGIRVVHERRIASDVVRYKLDVDIYPTRNGNQGAKEIFFFTVEISDSVPAMHMLSYERLSAYEFYSSCYDPRVDLKLCVCNAPSAETSYGQFIKGFYFLPDSFSSLILEKPTDGKIFMQRVKQFLQHHLLMEGTTITDHRYPKRKPCLFIFRHAYQTGFCIYAYSFCTTLHKIILRVDSNIYKMSVDKLSSHLLHYAELKSLVCGISSQTKSQTVIYSMDIIPFG